MCLPSDVGGTLSKDHILYVRTGINDTITAYWLDGGEGTETARLPVMKEDNDPGFGLNLGDGAHSEVLVLHQASQTRAGVQAPDHSQHTKDRAMGLDIVPQLSGKEEKMK